METQKSPSLELVYPHPPTQFGTLRACRPEPRLIYKGGNGFKASAVDKPPSIYSAERIHGHTSTEPRTI
eukprot:3369500-Amphidinium_carterae.1